MIGKSYEVTVKRHTHVKYIHVYALVNIIDSQFDFSFFDTG
jgi:hypothetical protein